MIVNYELRPSQKLMLYGISHSSSVDVGKLAEAFFFLFPDEFNSYSDVEKELMGLHFIGLIKFRKGTKKVGTVEIPADHVYLTEEGERIAISIYDGRNLILRPSQERQKTIFIASAFGISDLDDLYDQCFVPACNSYNYEPVRIDFKEPHQTITELMMNAITEAFCIFADLTFARPSVYFEVGFAQGLGIPLILTCREDHYRGLDDNSRVHFDLEQYKISFWSIKKNGKFRWKKHMSPKERLSTIIPTD